jgi:plasmid stability protein
MGSITIRNLDDPLKARLRLRAAKRGRSMEQEARAILRSALAERQRTPRNLAQAIRRRFAAVGGVDLPQISRDGLRVAPEFDP